MNNRLEKLYRIQSYEDNIGDEWRQLAMDLILIQSSRRPYEWNYSNLIWADGDHVAGFCYQDY